MAFDEELFRQSLKGLLPEEGELPTRPPEKPQLSNAQGAAEAFLKEIGEFGGTPAQRWSRETIAATPPIDPAVGMSLVGPLKGTVENFKAIGSGFVYGIGEHLAQYMGDVADNIISGRAVKGLARLYLGKIGPKETTEKLLELLPISKDKEPHAIAQEFYRGAEWWKSKAKQPENIIEKFYFALGSLPPVLTKYIIASKVVGGPIAGFALERYAQTLDPIEALRAASLGYVLGGTASMPYLLKTPAVASYAMVDAAVSGAEPEDILISGGVMALLTGMGKAPTWKQWRTKLTDIKVADIQGLDAEPRAECVNDLVELIKKRQLQIKHDPKLEGRILKQHRIQAIERDRTARPWKYTKDELKAGPIRPSGLDVIPPPKPSGPKLPPYKPSGGEPTKEPVTKKEFLDKTREEIAALRLSKRGGFGAPKLEATDAEIRDLREQGVSESVLRSIMSDKTYGEVRGKDIPIIRKAEARKVARKQVEQVERKSLLLPKIPIFKSTNEAQTFGKKASSAEIERMSDLIQDAEMLRDAATKASMGERAMEHGMDAQFLRESIKTSKRLIPEAKKAAKPSVDTAEEVAAAKELLVYLRKEYKKASPADKKVLAAQGKRIAQAIAAAERTLKKKVPTPVAKKIEELSLKDLRTREGQLRAAELIRSTSRGPVDVARINDVIVKVKKGLTYEEAIRAFREIEKVRVPTGLEKEAAEIPTKLRRGRPGEVKPLDEPYYGLKPGTPEWKTIWKKFPKLQTEMLEYKKQYAGVVESQAVKVKVESKPEPRQEPLLSAKEEAKLQKEIRLAEKKMKAETDKAAAKELKEHESKLLEQERAQELEDQAYDRMGISRYNREGIGREFEEELGKIEGEANYEIDSRATERRGVKAEKFENVKNEDTDVILSFLGLFGRTNKVLQETYEAYRKFERWIGRTKVGKYFVEHPGLTPEEIAIIDKRAAAEAVSVIEPTKILQDIMTREQQRRFLRKAKKYTKDERMIIGKLLRSNLTNAEVDADLRLTKVAKFAREEIDFLSELLVDILERQPRPPQKLIDTIRENQGTYMRREYLRNIDPDFKPAEAVIEDAVNWFQDNFTKGRGKNKRPVTRQEAEKIVDHLLAKGKPATFKREGFAGPRLKKRWLTKRKPMNEVLDALFGLIEDPVYPVVSGYLKTARFIEDTIYFEALAKNKNIASDTRQEGFTLLEGKQWGALDGKYVRNPMRFELEGAYREPGPVMKFFGNIISRWKVIKVSSPKTWGRNLITNTVMFNLSGCPVGFIPAYLGRAIRQHQTKGVYYNMRKQRGGLQRTLSQHELQAHMDIIDAPSTQRVGFWSFIDKVLALRQLSRAYGLQEDVYKTAKFIEIMRSPKRYKRDFEIYKREQPSADWGDFAESEAQKWFFDYSITSRFTKTLKNTLVPFITWQMKVMPRLVESAIKRPFTFWKYPAAAAYAFMKAKERMNLTPEEWEKVKKLYPSYLRRGQVLVMPWKDKNDNLRMTDLTFLMPGGFWLELFGGTYGAIKDKESFEALQQWVKTIGNPVLSAFVAMASGRDPYSGRDLWSDDTLNRDKWVNFLTYLVQLSFFSWMPGGYDFHKAVGLVRGSKDWATKTTKDIRWEIPGFVGLMTSPMDLQKFYMQAKVRMRHQLEEIQKQRRMAIRAVRDKRMPRGKYERRMRYLERKHRQAVSEMAALVEARDIAESKGLWHEPKE